MLHTNARGHGYGYVTRHILNGEVGLPYYGATVDEAIGRAYSGDRRIIPSAEQYRIAREYRARCAEEDAR